MVRKALVLMALLGCNAGGAHSTSPSAAVATSSVDSSASGSAGVTASASTPIDSARMQRAQVVLRVRLIELRGGSKYHWDRVEVLNVHKNESRFAFGGTLDVAHYGWKPGVPEGVSTLFLEPYGRPEQNLWKLLEADGSVGVSRGGSQGAAKRH